MTQTAAAPVTGNAPGPRGPGAPPARRPRRRPSPPSDAALAWAGPLLMTLAGGLLRFRRLGTPHALVFDEVYYVKEAASYLRYGYERLQTPVPSGSPDPFVAGRTDVFTPGGEFVVHPPVGKWMIAAGEWLCGPGPFGWRAAAATCGTLSILVLGRVAYRLLGSGVLATVASLLLAVDGLHLVLSRTGILDVFVMFWALAAFGCLLVDRDRTRALLERRTRGAPPGVRPSLGPWTGVRPWRVAAVACLTLCTGVKWSGLYVAAVLLTLSVLWDAGARRAAGVRHWVLAALGRDGAQALLTTAVVLPAGYLATWAGWFAGTDGYDRQWGVGHPADPGRGWVPDAVRALWHYHAEMWTFHLGLRTPHPYMADPWSWTVLGRPTAFFYERHTQGHAGCHVATCSQAVLALGNPAIWWAGTLAVAMLAGRWLLARDPRAGAVLAGLAAGWLPWFLYEQRTVFAFYAVAFVPWTVLAVTYCLGLYLGPPGGPPGAGSRRRGRVLAVTAYLGVVLLTSWFFLPVLTGQVVDHGEWLLRMWAPSWI